MIFGRFDLRLIFLPKKYCNYRCIFCHAEGISNARFRQCSFNFNPHELNNLIDRLRPIGLGGITVSGGEPLLSIKKVVDVCSSARNIPLTLLTNGTQLPHLLPYIKELQCSALRVNLNVPSFETHIFSRLTGQFRYAPGTVLGAIPELLQAGIEVNLSCVLCPGENDSMDALTEYINQAERYRIDNIRFVIQDNLSTRSEEIVDTFCLKEVMEGRRRDGRVHRYEYRGHCHIELVACESQKDDMEDFNLGSQDIYLSEGGTVKFGLFGQDHFFKDWNDLHLVIMNCLGVSV